MRYMGFVGGKCSVRIAVWVAIRIPKRVVAQELTTYYDSYDSQVEPLLENIEENFCLFQLMVLMIQAGFIRQLLRVLMKMLWSLFRLEKIRFFLKKKK
jgi:hypothetical protein